MNEFLSNIADYTGFLFKVFVIGFAFLFIVFAIGFAWGLGVTMGKNKGVK